MGVFSGNDVWETVQNLGEFFKVPLYPLPLDSAATAAGVANIIFACEISIRL